MKNTSLFLFTAVLLFSCNHQNENTSNRDSTSWITNSLKYNTIEAVDTSKPSAADTILAKSAEKLYLKEFLEAPFNFIDFKKKYGPSNSGNFQPNKLYYKPDKDGFYYRYMLFQNLLKGNSGMHYPNGEQPNESDFFYDFQIYVYHFKKPGSFDFYDTNEILIGFKSAVIFEGLGKADLVGKSIEETESLFGKEYIEKSAVRIYQNKKKVLSIKFENEKAVWIKYFHLSQALKKDSIPDFLLNF